MATDASGHSPVAESLERLKRRGCNLLVVGPAAPKLRQAATRRLVGDATAGQRRRLYVFTGSADTHPRLGNGPLRPETTRVVETEVTARSAAGTVSQGPGDVPRETVPGGDLPPVAWAAADAIDDLDSHAGGLSAGELRVCVDSLGPLLAAHGDTDVRRFLHVLGNRVRSVGGMAHYHLPAARDDAVVDRVGDAFDAVVEVRTGEDAPEHRWHFGRGDRRSDWLPL